MKDSKEKSFDVIKNTFISIGLFLATALLVVLFIFQASHLIISIWNIIPVAILIAIFVSAIKGFIKSAKTKTEEDTKKYEIQKVEHKLSIKSKILGFFICTCTLAISVLFFNIYSNKVKGLTLIDSTVISQYGETTYETDYDEFDDTETTTESSYCIITVSYEFNSNTKTAKITTTNTDKIYVEHLKIYINDNGDFVCDYGNILIWKLEAIVFLVFSILAIAFLILNYPLVFWAVLGMLFGGLALLGLFGKSCIENLIYNEILVFMSLFVLIGLFGVIGITLERFFETTKKVVINDSSPFEKNSQQDIEFRKNQLNRCPYCKSVNTPSATKCVYCNAPLKRK